MEEPPKRKGTFAGGGTRSHCKERLERERGREQKEGVLGGRGAKMTARSTGHVGEGLLRDQDGKLLYTEQGENQEKEKMAIIEEVARKDRRGKRTEEGSVLNVCGCREGKKTRSQKKRGAGHKPRQIQVEKAWSLGPGKKGGCGQERNRL